MFGKFRRRPLTRPTLESKLQALLRLYGDFTDLVTDMYKDFPNHNPAELRFFTMSATTAFIQAWGILPDSQMREIVDKFVEQSVAEMLFHMPKAEYSLVHNAFIKRFEVYSPLIADAINADRSEPFHFPCYDLVAAIDNHIGIERGLVDEMGVDSGASDRAMAGLYLSLPLTRYAISVQDSIRIE